MLPTAEERIPALTSSEEIFSLAVLFAACASEHRIGENAPEGKKTHQGIFPRSCRPHVGPMWAKWSGTHQDRKCLWTKTVLGVAIDANGNTLSDPSGKSYSWDFDNRLTQAVVPGTGTVSFRYDPLGRRIYKSSPTFTGIFVYDGPNLIETVSSSGAVLARYVHTQRIDEQLAELRSGGSGYYEADALGSITSLSSSTGALANTYTYDSFGKITSSTGTLTNPFQYTARESDSETGLYYYRARYYDPVSGRFISEDPIAWRGGVDFYRYAHNRPIGLRDPMGLAASDVQQVQAACMKCTQHLTSGGYRLNSSGPVWGQINDQLSWGLVNWLLGTHIMACKSQATLEKPCLENPPTPYNIGWYFQEQPLWGGSHTIVIGVSEDPNDPVVYCDPWQNISWTNDNTP